jgi:hypothetical protein
MRRRKLMKMKKFERKEEKPDFIVQSISMPVTVGSDVEGCCSQF